MSLIEFAIGMLIGFITGVILAHYREQKEKGDEL